MKVKRNSMQNVYKMMQTILIYVVDRVIVLGIVKRDSINLIKILEKFFNLRRKTFFFSFQLNAELNKRPINFAVESYCVDNLAALLGDPSVDVNSKNAMFKTPVNFLSEKIADDKFHNIFPCIKLLIQYGADVNLPDKREMTPIINILKNRNLSTSNKEIIVKYLLQSAVEVDIDSYRNGEARTLLQNLLPDIELTPNGLLKKNTQNSHKIDKQWDFNRLYLLLKNEKEEEFLQGLEQIADNIPHTLKELFTAAENRETLLIVAIGRDLPQAVERMIQLGADVNFFTDATKDTLSPLRCACIRGHWRSLELLIKSPELDINASPLLPTVVKNLGQPQTKHIDHEKCFEILLKHRNININQMDVFNCSALHYAVKFNNSTAIIKLLKRGAYIGIQNKFKELPILNINSKVLEKHFDTCITTNEFRMSNDNFEIGFDFKNLVPAQHSHNESITDEMTAIEYISKSKDLRHLMMHPLIASFLSLKWNRLALFFYINFFLCTLFAVTTISYILLYYNHDEPSSVKDLLRIIMFLLTIYIAIREMYQFTFSPCAYLKGLENYLECSLVVLVMLILFDVCSDDLRHTFAATTILLIAIEIFLLAGALPFWSFCTHYVMLKTVTWSFLKSLSLYAIILIAFSLSFFTLLNEPLKEKTAQENGKTNNDDNEEDEGDFNKFTNLGLSIMKVLVMSTGEFDVASINFKINTFSYFVFISFLFLVSIVLLSLLQGLAVSDTQAIKSEAELTNFIRRSQVLGRYEGVLTSKFVTLSY